MPHAARHTARESLRVAPSAPAALAVHRRSGFTLVDVLVTLSVVMVLLGLLMPSLSSVRETSRRVVCASNLRQIGIGLTLYADVNRDWLPHSMFLRGDQSSGNRSESKEDWLPSEMMHLRIGGRPPQQPERAWDGLGLLYIHEFLPASQVFYCPSHWGAHPFSRYIPYWKGANSGTIMGNYHYRGKGPNGSRLLSRIEPSRAAVVTDGLRTREDFNHKVGLNVLRADISVSWQSDGGRLFNFLPDSGEGTLNGEDYELLWNQIDDPDQNFLFPED